MEKIKLFLRTLRPWQIVILFSASLLLLSAGIYASRFLRQSAKIKLGSDTGLVLTADRQDSLGTFSDSAFTLKSDTDLTASGIKDKITFFPEVDFDISEITPRQFSLKPKQPLSDNSLYRIKVLSEQKTFSWAFQTKNDFRVVQTLPRDKATYVPLNTGIEITFSHDTYEDIDKYFEITPFVEGRFERHKRTVSFIPKSLSPGTLYTIKISKGLVLNGTKDSLKEDFKYQFETQPTASGGSQTQMYFPKNFYEFSPSETPAFDVYTSSTGGADVSVAVYQYPSVQGFHSAFITKLSIPTWASNSQRSHRVSTSGLSKVLEFNSPIQQQTYTNYFLFPQALPKGFYVVEANIGGGGGITTQALVQITDLSAYLSESSTKTLVWVNDIRTGQPVSGASVSFSSGKGGKTDQDGVAYFDSPPATPDNGEMVSISQGDNSLFIPAQGRLYYSQEYQNSRRLTDKYWSYFYSDRPVYLPTDTVRFWGLLRDRDNLNQKQQFTLEVTRSDYNSWDFNPIVLFTKDFETSDLGTFIGDIPLTSFNPGWYGITVKVGSAIVMSSSFSVETYTKPAYKLTLTPSKNAAIAGETINFSGLATFFEGSPVPSMDLTYSGAQSGTLTTDSLGRYSFNYVANASATSYSPDFKYQYIRSSLPEEGLIQADTSVAVFNSSVVFATPKSETEDNTGKVEIDLRQVDTDVYSYSAIQDIFSPAVNRQLSATLFENQWNKKEVGTYYDFINKVTSPRYEYEQIKNKIADITLATDGQGKAVYEFPVAEDKSYNLIVNAADDQGRTTSQDIYISGISRNYYLNNNVYLKTDKSGPNTNNFAIGEQVNLQIMRGESPLEAASTDKFLYQFAQRGLKSYQILDQSNISFKFADAFVPNVVVAAVRFTGKTYQVSENTNLYFDTASKKLTLDVTQDKSSYLPGDTAKISVLVKDASGTPASAEVNLSLLDEAYSAIFPSIADPLIRIYNSLDADIIASYYSHQYPIDAGGAEGGGCFLPGTEIIMGNGATKRIEDIKVGDRIKTLESPKSTKLVSAKVTQVFEHQVAGYLLINGHLRVTGEHNLYINGRFLTTSEVRVGDSYLDSHGRYKKIISVENYSGLNTVYNFTVDKLSTYFADGFYVHNEKGRELFVDNAFFGSVRTGGDGRATVDVKLPDNLTSWRITSQAITGDIKAGFSSSPLLVKQPFFVDAVMNTEYLLGDHPQILVRAYGENLSKESQVTIKIKSDTLGLSKDITLKAFESAKVDLGSLTEGNHKLSITGQSGNMSDTLIRSFKVIKSRLLAVTSVNVALSPDTKPQGSANASTSLIISDLSLGRFFPPLANLAYTWGDRLDQRLARTLSQEIIKSSFDDSIIPEKLDLTAFQAGGGYALFPYSSADLEPSTFVAALVGDKVDQDGLANYFFRQFSEAKDPDTAAMSLFGLSCLDQPVLLLIDNLSDEKDLTPLARIYLALAQVKIGDTEKALQSYRSLISEYSQKQDNFMYVKVGSDKDSYLQATALMSSLAALLGEGDADSLLAYTLANSGKDVLLVSPQLITIAALIGNTKPEPVSFAYTLNDKKITKRLENGQVFKLILSPIDLESITFSDISGNVGLTTSYLAPLDPQTAAVDPSVSINRNYSVKGKVTNNFTPSDLIKISLPISFKEVSQDGCYQVSDLLPSGLKPVTAVFSLGLDSTNIWYPYEINGQKVSFCVGKDHKGNTINYYARVVSGGDYQSESALIQSLISPSVYNLSPAGAVSIK